MIGDTSSLFVAKARTALKIALKQVGIQSGDRVLVPDFICDAAVNPLLQANLIPVYFPVNRDLTPDWQTLESIATNHVCRVMIMVHYFGQPQNIEQFRTFCTLHGLLLLEDNAHGYGGQLAGKPLGTFGAIGISSPRKILGTPSGGVLYGADALSSQYARSMRTFPAYRPVSILKAVLHLMPMFRRLVKGRVDRSKNWDDPRLFQETIKSDYAIDWFSLRRIRSADWQEIATRRRKNWLAWANFARSKGLQPAFADVHTESCPWAMPAYAGNQLERNSWLAWGARNGVPLFPWPTLPEEIILLDGDALARWATLVCFPLDISPKE